MKIYDCRAFSLLETELACRVFIHSVKGKNKSRGGGKSDTLSMFDEKVTGNARFEPLCFGHYNVLLTSPHRWLLGVNPYIKILI